jgi:hypothetical protein
VHTDLYGPPPFWPIGEMQRYPVTGDQLVAALDRRPGFHRLSYVDGVAAYRIVLSELRC